ncbi:endonuclease V [Stetteria hydrogenophila]
MRSLFSPQRAARAQELLRSKLVLEGSPSPRVVAGVDAAYSRRGGVEVGFGVAVALEWGSWRLLACRVAVAEACVPYIPGLLAFREMLVMAPALASLRRAVDFDLVVVDGHGIAHPRGLGIASHVGVAFNKPSIGVAKRRLVGREVEEGGVVYIVHEGVKVGVVLKTRRGRKLYVSPGHRVGLAEAVRLVEEMLGDASLPRPVLEADRISKAVKKLAPARPGGRVIVTECPRLPWSLG